MYVSVSTAIRDLNRGSLVCGRNVTYRTGKVFNVSRILNLHFSNVPNVRRNNEKGSSSGEISRNNIFLACN